MILKKMGIIKNKETQIREKIDNIKENITSSNT
jgi:hypothetical protein